MGGDAEPAGPAIELPGGQFGAGYIIPGSNPAFQANSLAAPTDQSEAGAPPYATLNPRPATAFTTGNLAGAFGSQLAGSPGVLGVFEALPGKGTSPCPSSASESLVYAYAPISATTTPAELSGSPGVSSPWRPLAEADCDGTDPAVGGGPSGLGLLETNEAHVPNPGPIVQYRHFSPSSGFGSAVTLATDEVGNDGTLSQDGAGDIFATWRDNATGVDFAYSSDGGAAWSKPKVLSRTPASRAGLACCPVPSVRPVRAGRSTPSANGSTPSGSARADAAPVSDKVGHGKTRPSPTAVASLTRAPGVQGTVYATSCGWPLLPGFDVSGPPSGTSTVLPKTAIGALADVGSWRW